MFSNNQVLLIQTVIVISWNMKSKNNWKQEKLCISQRQSFYSFSIYLYLFINDTRFVIDFSRLMRE